MTPAEPTEKQKVPGGRLKERFVKTTRLIHCHPVHQLVPICSISDANSTERPSERPGGGANPFPARSTGCEPEVSGGELGRRKVMGKVRISLTFCFLCRPNEPRRNLPRVLPEGIHRRVVKVSKQSNVSKRSFLSWRVAFTRGFWSERLLGNMTE